MLKFQRFTTKASRFLCIFLHTIWFQQELILNKRVSLPIIHKNTIQDTPEDDTTLL